jgi:hypothetical protein
VGRGTTESVDSVGRRLARVEQTGLLSYRQPGHPETQRWPAVDSSGQAVGGSAEKVLWSGIAQRLACFAERRTGEMRLTYLASLSASISLGFNVAFTDRRVLYSLDDRSASVLIETRAWKAFRRSHVLVGQLRYEWVTHLRWQKGRLGKSAEGIGFDVRTGDRNLRLVIRLGVPNSDTAELIVGILSSAGVHSDVSAESLKRPLAIELDTRNRLPDLRDG